MATKCRLTAEPLQFEQNEYGQKVLKRVRFTASDGGNKPERDFDLSAIDGMILALYGDNVEKGIRTIQAIKRAEAVEVGWFEAEELEEFGFEGLNCSKDQK